MLTKFEGINMSIIYFSRGFLYGIFNNSIFFYKVLSIWWGVLIGLGEGGGDLDDMKEL